MEYLDKIENEWDKKSHKMDWLGLESVLRDILRSYKKGQIDSETAILDIDEAIAAYTKRGNELDAEKQKNS